MGTDIQSDVANIRKVLNDYNSFVITGHANPDGDAIGACYSMGMALVKMGKTVKVVIENYHEKFNIIPGSALRYTGEPCGCQVFLCLDCGSLERAGESKNYASQAEITVCIDHHVSNTGFGDYLYVDPDASSTCELIYDVLDGMVAIDVDIGTAIYAGLVYDTGGFRHDCTSAKTMETAAKLIRLGIPFSAIYNELCVNHTFLESKVLSRALEHLALTPDRKIAYTWISLADMRQIGVTPQDMEGIVEYILGTDGVKAALFLYEKTPGDVKCSFRSVEADVSKIARCHGGGGHIKASGCNISGGIYEVMEIVLEELKLLI